MSYMSDDHLRCMACSAVLPIVRSGAVSWTTGLVVTGFGVTAAKTWWGRLFAAGLGIAAATVVDRLARPVCGRCGLAT